MEREELKATLLQLHQQLQSGEPVDPEIAVLVKQLSQDVNQWAAPAPATTSTPATEHQNRKQSLLDSLLGLTKQFEETHPELADAIGRVATALSRIGI
ncbi:DUF4404 family protein [Planctomicrobium sp. SH661]|uniref:DUF4404 family protein n=1 Tax=Planctomicrobium sp. SH661 TaxID=3448124 RepID=UPI003F5B805C